MGNQLDTNYSDMVCITYLLEKTEIRPTEVILSESYGCIFSTNIFICVNIKLFHYNLYRPAK